MTKPTKWVCAQRRLWSDWADDSGHPGHPPSLIRVFAVRLKWVAKDPSFPHTDSEDSDQTGHDQTGRMPRLIWVFAGRTLILLVLSCRGSNVRSAITNIMSRLKGNTSEFPSRGIYRSDLSRLMTKPTKWLCAQLRLRSAWASAQSDQSLRCPDKESLGP